MPDLNNQIPSMYGSVQPQGMNLLGMIGQLGAAQNVLASRRVGQIMQQSIDPQTGEIDYHKAAIGLSTDPLAAPLAPSMINQWIQREVVQKDSLLKTMQIERERGDAVGSALGTLLNKARDQGGKLSIDDVLKVSSNLAASKPDTFTPEWQARVLSTFPNLKDKAPSMANAQHVRSLAQTLMPQKDLYDRTHDNIVISQGGQQQYGQRDTLANKVYPAPGGTFPQTPTIAERGARVTTVKPTGEESVNTAENLGLVPKPQVSGGVGDTRQISGEPSPAAMAAGKAQLTQGMVEQNALRSAAAGGPGVVTKLAPPMAGALQQMAKYKSQVDDEAALAIKNDQVIGKINEARSHIQTGGFAERRAALGQLLQGFGLPQSVVDDVSNKSLPWSQAFSKLQPQLASSEIRKALMPGAGKILQSEWEVFLKNVSHIDQDPKALDEILGFLHKVNGIARERQFFYTKSLEAQQAGRPLPRGLDSLVGFDSWFNDQLTARGHIPKAAQ